LAHVLQPSSVLACLITAPTSERISSGERHSLAFSDLLPTELRAKLLAVLAALTNMVLGNRRAVLHDLADLGPLPTRILTTDGSVGIGRCIAGDPRSSVQIWLADEFRSPVYAMSPGTNCVRQSCRMVDTIAMLYGNALAPRGTLVACDRIFRGDSHSLPSVQQSWLFRFLCLRSLRYVGKISYGLYLIHIPAYLAVHAFMKREFGPEGISRPALILTVTTEFLLSFALAALSWRFFESPLLRLKRFFPARPAETGAPAA